MYVWMVHPFQVNYSHSETFLTLVKEVWDELLMEFGLEMTIPFSTQVL
jgi:hypothetical protein